MANKKVNTYEVYIQGQSGIFTVTVEADTVNCGIDNHENMVFKRGNTVVARFKIHETAGWYKMN